MPPSMNQVDIWIIDITQFSNREDYFYSLLNDVEKNRADAFVTALLKSRYTISQGILRLLLADYLSLTPPEIKYTFGAHKKPYLEHNPQALYFNLSHSEDMALIGLSYHDEVGVDIEKLNPKTLEKDLERSIFSKKEMDIFNSLSASKRLEAFFSAWTHKEALMKLTGEGLYKEPKELEVPLAPLNQVVAVKYDDAEKYLRSFYVTEHYMGAVASTKSNFDLEIHTYSI